MPKMANFHYLKLNKNRDKVNKEISIIILHSKKGKEINCENLKMI
jgi:hypothetical protein